MLKLTFIGDIFPGDEIFTAGFGIRSGTTPENALRWSQEFSSVLGSADFIIGNLESPLTDDCGEGLFCGRPAFADILKEAGVNVLNIANNHILEHGEKGFQDTLSALESRGILSIGEAESDASKILIIKKDGTTVCLAAFCDESISSIGNPGLYASLEEERVLRTLEKMKSLGPDIMVFCMHWGNEYIHIPSPEQRRMAHLLIDDGADLVVGHHPHVIQPYERYKDGHILYSLGNFCFDDLQSRHFGLGMAAQAVISDGKINCVSLSGIELQDLAYGDSLVKAIPEKDFNDIIAGINGNYASLEDLTDDSYRQLYGRECKKARAKERVLMRLNIIKKLLSPRHRYRRQFITNLIKMHRA